MSDIHKRLLLFAALIGWCAALLVLRVGRSHSLHYGFLVWNLFLAAIPAAAALMLTRTQNRFVSVALFVMWLAFLPNAPYIVTDFIHLNQNPPVPLWYDVALLISFAGTGLLLAYSSVKDVQGVVTARFNKKTGWIVALGSLLLSGFGIYLGRFLRWNSWDPLANPGRIAGDVLQRGMNPLDHPRTIAVTLIYGVGLALGYVALRIIFGAPANDSPQSHGDPQSAQSSL